MASWIDPLLPSPGKQWWGSKFLNLCFKKVEEVVDGKAPADHEHGEAGSLIVTRGDVTDRSPIGTTLHVRSDLNMVEFVVDGVVLHTMADNSALPPIELTDWQTNPNEYTVKAMNIDNIDGVGADCFFKYVFPDGISPMMRTQTYPLPFSGRDLQFNFSWRGTVAGNGSSYAHFRADVMAIPAGVAVGQKRTWSEWTTFFNAYSSAKKTSAVYAPIPTGSADTFQIVTGTNLVVPASIYDQGDVLLINFWRISSDTYSGQVEVGKISLVPVLAA